MKNYLREWLRNCLTVASSRVAAVWCPRFSVLRQPDTLKGGHRTRFFGYALQLRIFPVILFLATPLWAANGSPIPHLEKKGTATQLIVDGKLFLILGGELHNSSSSSLDYMKPIWSQLHAMNLNTVVTPVSWELIEPQEGKFDFTIVDGLIRGARQNDLRLVFLWFGSWKNSMSSYTPAWVKTDEQRFPLAQSSDGKGLEILSPFSDTNCAADATAFAALMKHLREFDGRKHTVIMVQVENEIGMIPEARDHSAIADQLYSNSVPQELMDYLQQHRDALTSELTAVWGTNGFKTSGTWQDVLAREPERKRFSWPGIMRVMPTASPRRAKWNIHCRCTSTQR